MTPTSSSSTSASTEEIRGSSYSRPVARTTALSGGGDHYGNFVDAVRSRNADDLNADIEEGHLSSALCHLGNVSYRLGSQISAKEVAKRLDGDAEATETFDRVAGHLGENKVDLSDVPVGFGAQLTLDGEKEVFTGDLASKANPMLTRNYRKPFVVPSANEV